MGDKTTRRYKGNKEKYENKKMKEEARRNTRKEEEIAFRLPNTGLESRMELNEEHM